MFSLGGVRVPATDAWQEGQAIGELFAGLLTAAGDGRAQQHVLQLWATAHGLVALHVVGRIVLDPVALHTLLEGALTDCLTRALATTTPGPITRSRETKQP